MRRFTRGLCLMILWGALAETAAAAPAKPDYIIREGFFAGMMMDIFMELSRYEGKTVQYEGFILPLSEENFGEGPETFAVVRIASCCGPDDMPIGFACVWAGATPAQNAWVRVTGVLRSREEASVEEPGESYSYPYLEVTALEGLKKRGREKVSQ